MIKFVKKPMRGYNFIAEYMNSTGYRIIAIPVNPGIIGTKKFIIETGYLPQEISR